MFAFAKQLVRSAEGIISNPQGNFQGANYDNYRGSDPYGSRSDPTHGFRVIHVLPGSPAFQAGIESLFDFVIGINGHDIVGQQAQVQTQQFQQYEPSYQNSPGLQSIKESGPAPFYDSPNSQPNPYAPQQASSAYNYTAESTNPRVHHRGSLSFTSASGIIPQLVPPSPETSPLDPFIAEIANCRGRSISLEIWSSKGRTRRTIVLPVPSLQASSEKESKSLGIGVSLQWTSLSVGDHVWHVLNVASNSPAEAAGLISHSDYIVGAENGLLEAGGEDLLGRVIQKIVSTHSTQRKAQQHQLQTSTTADEPSPSPPIVNSQPELELFVYNHEYDTLRAVRIRPTSNWGGSGLLGCGVGYGLLHRLPVKNGQENINTGNGDNFQQVAHRRHFSGSTQPHHEPPLASPTIHEVDEHELISTLSAGGPPSSFFTPANNMGIMPSTSAFVPAMSAPPIGPPPMSGASNTLPGPPQLGPPPILGSQLPPSRKKKHHHYPTVGSTLPPPQGPDAGNPVASRKLNNDLAAYFAEEEQRSKELDGYSYKPSIANSALPPPPPPPPTGGA